MDERAGACQTPAMPEVHQHRPGTPCWVDVAVSTTDQRERLTSFYSALFSWTWEVSGPEMGFYSIAHLDGAAVMGLGQGEGGAGVMVPYFATDDLEASGARARGLGGDVFMGPMAIADVGSMALVLDPTGVVHGLWQAGTFAGFERAWEPGTPGWFDHVSTDPGRAAAYYIALTGHSLHNPSPELRALAADGEMFASLSDDQVPGRAPQWNVVWVADSLERVRETVRSLGATVVVEEMPVPGAAITVFVEPVMGASITVMAGGPDGQ